MRTSRRLTTVAALRAFISECIHPQKITALEFAEMFGRTVNAIQSVECGRLPLSEALALRISHETGASLSWLLDGKPNLPITDRRGKRYDRETFERARSKKYERFSKGQLSMRSLEYYSIIRSLLRAASHKGDAELAAYRLWSAIIAVARDFGAPEQVQTQNKETFEEHVRRIVEEDIPAAVSGLIVYNGVSQYRPPIKPKRKRRSLPSRGRKA
jgi:transcriptional regulator with XRE-family HTH domain